MSTGVSTKGLEGVGTTSGRFWYASLRFLWVNWLKLQYVYVENVWSCSIILRIQDNRRLLLRTCYSTHFLQTVCSSSSLLFVSVQAHNICSGYIRVYEMEETSGSWIVKMFGPSVASIDNFASCFSFQVSGSF